MKTVNINGTNINLICSPLKGIDFELSVEGTEHIELLLNSNFGGGFVDCAVLVNGENFGTYTITWEIED